MRHLWNELKAQLILVTSFRENENITEIFERRIRNNEQVARRVWNLQKKMNRTEQQTQTINNRDQIHQNINRSIMFFIFTATRVERLINNYQRTINKAIAFAVISVLVASIAQSLKKFLISMKNSKLSRQMKRSCRHCKKSHWNYEYSN